MNVLETVIDRLDYMNSEPEVPAVTLTAFGKTYNLEINISKYTNNNRIYIWLIDTEDGCPFCDITENHPEISDYDLFTDDYWVKVILDNDFISCFPSVRDCKIWCMDNLHCLGWGEVDWRPALYLTKECIQYLKEISLQG